MEVVLHNLMYKNTIRADKYLVVLVQVEEHILITLVFLLKVVVV